VRENYAHADVGGVIVAFELDSTDAAKRYTDDFPLSRAGLLEWQYLAFDAPLPLEFLFDPSVDLAEPGIARRPQQHDPYTERPHAPARACPRPASNALP
jgi:hypothetical protein